MATAKLCYVLGTQTVEWPLDGDQLTIGRLPPVQLILPEWITGISRHHATLRKKNDSWWLDDAASRYGTFLNGQRIQSAELHDGDMIQLGDFAIRFLACATARVLQTMSPESGEIVDPAVSATDLINPPPNVSVADRGPTNVTLRINLDNLQVSSGVAETAFPGVAERTSPKPPPVSLRTETRAFGPDQAWAVALFSDVGRALQVSTDLNEMFGELLSLLFTHVPAERGLIGLLDSAGVEIVPRVTRSATAQPGQPFELSRTILRTAIDSRTALLVEDTVNDERFRQAVSIRRLAIHSAMCIPLYHEGRVSGVLYLDTQDPMEPFRQRHLEIATAVALFMAVAVEQFYLRERAREEENKRQRLARYSSPTVVERILRAGDDGLMLADKENVTILFTDLSGFTSLSEKLPPDKVVELLNSVFTRLTDTVFRHQGTLDKFIGDGMLAFFGAPLPQPDHALRAVRAAWEMLAAIAALNHENPESPPIAVRIGINSGPVVVGDIGSLTRKEYTVIGDTVNVASRLESTVAAANQIAIGPATFESVRLEFDCQPLEPVRLKGKSEPIQPYRVLGPQRPES